MRWLKDWIDGADWRSWVTHSIVGVLIAVAQTVGLARVASAAPAVALALGYDIDAALEAHDEGGRPVGVEHG